jgi:hypothetical protein
LVIAASGVPVPKRRGKPSVRDVAVNNGLHHHAILLVLASTRLDHGVDVEAAGNKEAYLGRHGKLRDIDVRPITETEGDVVGCALKQVARNPASVDDILVLSKAASELSRRSFSMARWHNIVTHIPPHGAAEPGRRVAWARED